MKTHPWIYLWTLPRPEIRDLAGLLHEQRRPHTVGILGNPQLLFCRRPFFPSRLESSVKRQATSANINHPLEKGKAEVAIEILSQGEQNQTSVCRVQLNSSLVQQSLELQTYKDLAGMNSSMFPIFSIVWYLILYGH